MIDTSTQLAAEKDKPPREPLPLYASGLLFFSSFNSALAILPFTNADMSIDWTCLFVPLTGSALIFWLVTAYHITMPNLKTDRRAVRILILSNILAITMLMIGCSGVGFLARVWLSSSALERFALTVPPDTDSIHEHRRLGLFIVDWYDSSEDGAVAMSTSGSGMMNRAGVLYMPPGTTRPLSIHVEQHLFGPWYRFWWKF